MSAAPIFPHTITPWQSMPDKDAVIAHYAAEEAKAAEEAQQAKDAARYRWIRDASLEEVLVLTDLASDELDAYIDAAISEQ